MTALPPEARLATFNIQYGAQALWLRKRDRLGELLRDCGADFLCLQEVSPDGFGWLRDALGRPACAGAGRDDGAERGEHVPIFVLDPRWRLRASGTFWFSPTPDEPSRAWGAAHKRICTWVEVERAGDPPRQLAVFNVHLDHKSRRARTESLRLLAARLAGLPRSCPALLCGDFNLRRPARAHALLAAASRDFTDVGGRLAPAVATWDGLSPFGFGRGRIDYVFADAAIDVRHYAVLPNRHGRQRLSDHHPVIVDFDLRGEAGP